jgi:hypothetical protein
MNHTAISDLVEDPGTWVIASAQCWNRGMLVASRRQNVILHAMLLDLLPQYQRSCLLNLKPSTISAGNRRCSIRIPYTVCILPPRDEPRLGA